MNEVLRTITNRRSIRRFKSDPIEDQKLQAILDAGRWAPSFSNLQPWKFMVIKNRELKEALDRAAKESVLPMGVSQAPVVILVCVDRRIDPLHAIEAGAAATQNIVLAACSLGFGTGWIGIWDTEAELAIRRLLKLGDTVRVVSLIPIGIADESPKIDRKHLEEITQVL